MSCTTTLLIYFAHTCDPNHLLLLCTVLHVQVNTQEREFG